jgi:hypothetical protein
VLAGAGLGEEGVEGVVAAAEWSCRTASGRKVLKGVAGSTGN